MRKPMRVNSSTYGWFYPETSVFECTHGAWSGSVSFIDDTKCTIYVVHGTCTYKWLDELPEEYIF